MNPARALIALVVWAGAIGGQARYLGRTLAAVRRRGDLPAAGLDRVELDVTLEGDLAGYRFHPVSGSRSYRTLLTGGEIETLPG